MLQTQMRKPSIPVQIFKCCPYILVCLWRYGSTQAGHPGGFMLRQGGALHV
jgi:hypothetical protein